MQAGSLEMRQERLSHSLGRARLDVLRVDPQELLRIEDGRRRLNVLPGKFLDQLVPRKNFLVAMRPAEPGQVIDHGLRQISHVFVRHDRRRPVALRETRFVGPEDHGEMAEARRRKPEGLEDRHLPRGVRQVVVPADHMRDAHQRVVHDDGKIIGRVAVRPENDQIIQHRVVEDHRALDEVVHYRLAFLRGFKSQGRLTGRFGGQAKTAAPAVIPRRQALGLRLLPSGFKILSSAHAPVRPALLEQPKRMAGVQRHPLGLAIRPFVPIEAHPLQAFEDGLDGLVGRTALVGILDAEDEPSVLLPGEEPVEQRGANPSDMEIAGGTRRETDADLIHKTLPRRKGRYL